MAENEAHKVPVRVESSEGGEAGAGEEDRGWREVADRWRRVGRQVRDLGERLTGAFKMGWEVEEMAAREARGVADRIRDLGERMERAVEEVRSEARRPETKERARETMKATRTASKEFFQELEETLEEGFDDLNRRVDEVLEKRQEKKTDS